MIAAVIIVGVIVTLAAVNISTKTVKEDTTIYDLSREIDYESSQLIDYGVYTSQTGTELNQNILGLVSNYSASNPDTDLLIVYGNEEAVTGVLFSKAPTGFQTISTGGAPIGQIEFTQTAIQLDTSLRGRSVEVKWENRRLANFTLKPGENFYMILQKDVGEERLVAQQ